MLNGAIKDFLNVFSNRRSLVADIPTLLRRIPHAFSVWKAMMRGHDRASDRLIRMQIEITDRCNYDCIMCNRLTRDLGYPLKNDLDFDLLMHTIDDVQPLYVTLNGLGEPLLHHDIDKITAGCRSRGITTSMPTNLSISRVLLDKMIKNPPSIFQFSIHGGTKEVFEAISRGSNFERCIENARRFLASADRSKTHVRVLCALQAKNLQEHQAMYRLLKELDLLGDFWLVPVYDYDPQQPGQAGDPSLPVDDRRVIPTAEEQQAAFARLRADIQAARDPAERRFYEHWLSVMQEIKPNDGQQIETGPCLIPWFSTYITARGDVLPCCYLTGEQTAPGGNVVMGNVFETSFTEIWNGEAYQQFRRRLREDRAHQPGCNYCPRNDRARLNRYGAALFPGSEWEHR